MRFRCVWAATGLVLFVAAGCEEWGEAACPQPSAGWIKDVSQTFTDDYRDLAIDAVGYLTASTTEGTVYYAALTFEGGLRDPETGLQVEGAVAVFGTNSSPAEGRLDGYWPANAWASQITDLPRRPAGPQDQADSNWTGITASRCV
jgi:hypothetical protein